ncbi:MAG TPA: hypothetical protein VHI93_01845 [Candidatus Thermoplasmatota archaeon]|nr:hypothetical protein [Candidatus Thermoplasmatota archaeon]
MAKAAALLARAWHRARRRWWWAATASFTLCLVAIVLVSGLFAGLQAATARHVGDFYTGDLRVTRSPPGVAPDLPWDGAEAEAAARLLGPGAHGRLESELILSRRSLVQAYLEEQGQYQVGGPDLPGNATRRFGIGILAGLAEGDPLRDRVRQHLLAGRLPLPRTDRVELVLSLKALETYLTPSERANLSSWPPRAAELEAFGFEATAGYVDNTGFFKDIVRRPAAVVGLYRSGLDALDGLTAVGDLEGARLLQPGAAGRVNAFTVTGDAAQARQVARSQGWHAEDAAAFAGRYLGQLLDTVRALSFLAAGLFLVVPAFLLWHGIQQTLDLQKREIAVCRAIGVGRGVLSSALARLAWRVAGWGLLGAAIAAAVLHFALPPLLEGSRFLPLPLGFAIDWPVAGAAAGLALLSTWVALGLARRAGRQESLPAALRAA